MKDVSDYYPLSPMQQGMLFHSLLAPESGVYVEQMSARLTGELDPAAFERAWQQAAERHTILRTAFLGEGFKEPIQVVHRHVDLRVAAEDWRALPPETAAARLADYLSADRARGFDLAHPPLMRLALLRTAERVWQLVWTYHHILLDGWSLPILMQEVFAAYAGGAALAPEPARPFRDYIVWLRRQNLRAAETYWRRALAGFRAPTPLFDDWPAEIIPPAGEPYREEETWLTVEASRRLQSLARDLRITLSTLVQAGWAALLGRYSGEEDVLFGATVSGRPADLPGAERMVGLFINTLPVRARLAGDTPVREWLPAFQAQLAEMRQYEFSPLVDIQGWSEVPRGQPLFESLVVFENYPVSQALGAVQGEIAIDDLRGSEQTNFPLNLVAGAADRVMLKLLYDTRRFTAAGMRRMLEHLEMLLTGMAADPSQPLSALPMATPAERQDLLFKWNATRDERLLERTALELIDAQVWYRPGAEAVVFGERSLSYAELDRRANRVAHALRAQGVGLGARVGICMEPSLALVPAILGALKAGAAYLPLDPAYPAERLAFMLADSQVSHVLTQPRLAPALPAGAPPLICLDEGGRLDPVGADRSDLPLADSPRLDDLAYVIYTSGSTGQPKGALLTHRGLANQALGFAQGFGTTPASRVAQAFSISFDGSVAAIFSALVSGAAVVLAGREEVLSAVDFADLLERQEISEGLFPPSLISMLPERAYPRLRVVGAGGETCPVELARRWSAGRRFINAYGPTETTVAATFYTLEGAPPPGLARVPIGRLLPNYRGYILDRSGLPAPIGVMGELLIGGPGVGRGYLNREALTAEKFVPDPYAEDGQPGARLYRTGDLARWRPDGAIEFLGRSDTQVKIRGYRIELGEVESAVGRHPLVQACVAAACPDPTAPDAGIQQLVAYVVPRDGEAPDLPELRGFLRERLPEYMLPAALVVLETLPIGPAGKVDRRSLPLPGAERGPVHRELVGPRDVLEAQLRQIWEEVLGVHPLSIDDNFFDLGGHSLSAVRLAAQVKQHLGLDLPISTLFANPTVERLARALADLQPGAEPSPLVPIQPLGKLPPLFMVHPSGGSVHWYFELALALGQDQPLYGFQARGLTGDQPLHTSIDEMAAWYVQALRAFQPQGPYRLASWSMGVIVVYEMARQLAALGQPVSFLGMLDQGPALPLAQTADDAAYLAQLFGEHIPIDVDQLRGLPADERVGWVLQKAKEIGFVYPDTGLEQFQHFVDTLHTHTEAWRAYPLETYPGRVTVFRALEQPHDPALPPDLGWGALALGGAEVVEVPGDHLSMMHDPHVLALAQALGERLGETEPAGDPGQKGAG
jgi:amino acid adenylation domain-containing protein